MLGAIAAPGIVTLDLAPDAARASPTRPRSRARARSRPTDVRASLARGRPVFVYFTADWCVTCKVNESACSPTARIAPELERLGYDVYRADWTRRDEAIRSALAALGKAGVPVYAVYAPGAPDHPRLLPELLTVDGLLDALREGAGGASRRRSVTPLTQRSTPRPRCSRGTSRGGCMPPARVRALRCRVC